MITQTDKDGKQVKLANTVRSSISLYLRYIFTDTLLRYLQAVTSMKYFMHEKLLVLCGAQS